MKIYAVSYRIYDSFRGYEISALHEKAFYSIEEAQDMAYELNKLDKAKGRPWAVQELTLEPK